VGGAGARVDKDVRRCVACAERVGAVRRVGNGHQICHERALSGPETRRRGSPVAGVGQLALTRAHGRLPAGRADSGPPVSLRTITRTPELPIPSTSHELKLVKR
jgi:hypothetical protein